jgi:DNA-binding FadR family transcriptional regulator
MDRFNVSRAVIREAARLLEHQTVAFMKRGPSGGLIVREPDSTAAITALKVYLDHAGVTVDAIVDARVIVEPLAAEWAAETISEEGIQLLRAAVTGDRDGSRRPRELPAGELVHLAIAQQSGNVALELFVDVLIQLTDSYGRPGTSVNADRSRPGADRCRMVHSSIVDSVVAGRSGEAHQLAERHLTDMSSRLANHATATRAAPRRALPDSRPSRESTGKLAEQVAAQIRRDLLRANALSGEVIGSEGALLQRYGVSRAVLREAIRLLEFHRVARTRRGPGGGLVITEPSPTASADAMALLLDYRHVTVDQVLVLRDAIELACVARVARRSSDPEVAQALNQLAQSVETLGASGHVYEAHSVHHKLAELSGNPLLATLVGILTTLYHRHAGHSSAIADPGPTVRRTVQVAHSAILDAIADGDAVLAQHRMRRHLSALRAWWR